MNLRRSLEHATRDLVLKRRLPAEYGYAPIFVTPSSGLKFLFRSLADVDPDLLARASEFVGAGASVWDVGANVGLFTFAAAHCAGPSGRVYAFEPDVWLANLLERSAAAQSATSAPTSVVPVAIASAPGFRKFHLAVRSRSTNFLAGYGSTQTGGVRAEKLVMTYTLDWLVDWLPIPTVLKIDVEGAELEVLQGGLRLLKECRPVVLCEIARENSPTVTELLRSLAYRLYDGDLAPDARAELALAAWNTIAVPEERSPGWFGHGSSDRAGVGVQV